MNKRISGIASRSKGVKTAMRILALSLSIILCRQDGLCSSNTPDAHYPSERYIDYVRTKAADMPLLQLKQWADTTYYRTEHRLDAEPIYKEVLSRAISPLSEEDEKLIAAAYSNYATLLLFERSNPIQAYPMLKRSLELIKKYQDDGFSLVGTYTNMSLIYANFNDTVKALNYLKEGFENTRKSSKPQRAGYIYAQLLQMAWDFNKTADIAGTMTSFKNDKRLIGGHLYGYNMEVTKAVEDYNAARYSDATKRLKAASSMIDSEYDHDVYRTLTLLMAAESAIKGNNTVEAKGLIDEATASIKENEEFNNKVFLNKILSEYYRLAGNPELAEAYDLRSLILRDSLYSARNMTAISDIEQNIITSKYNTELKEAELQQQILREKNIRQHSLLIVISLASAAIITLLLFLIYKKRKLTECRYDLLLKNVDLPAADENIKGTAPASVNEDADTDAENLAGIFGRVRDFISTRQEVFDPGFSIDMMSELTGISIRLISRAINRHAGKNFSLFVADFRIREACRILLEADPAARPTIECVAEKVGYRSRSHFSRTFKSVTGLTTTEFIRQSQKRNS